MEAIFDPTVLAVAFIVTVIIFTTFWFYPSSNVAPLIPGLAPSSKKDGNLGDVSRAGSLHQFLMELHSRFGPITAFWWEQTHVVSIASPELMKEQHHAYDRPPFLFKGFGDLVTPECIQITNGLDAQERRRAYDPMFAFQEMSKYLHCFDQLAKETEAKWLQHGDDSGIPLYEDSLLYAIKAALVALMGDYYKDQEAFLNLKNAYDLVWNEMEWSMLNKSPRDKRRQDQFDKAKTFLTSSIKEVISHRKKNGDSQQEYLFIDLLIEKYPNEDKILVSDAIIFLVGAFHTTGNVITWALYYLANNKDIQDKVLEEVKNVLGDEGSVDENTYPGFEYLIQVIDETLRCAVVAPWAARFQDNDSELGGYKIPKQTPVIHALGVLMKNEKLWPSPNRFDPDRFSPENRKKMSNYTFVPFGFAGKRKCPAYRFAYWDTVAFLATILRRFEISMWKDQEISPVYGFVTHPNTEIWIKATKRN